MMGTQAGITGCNPASVQIATLNVGRLGIAEALAIHNIVQDYQFSCLAGSWC